MTTATMYISETCRLYVAILFLFSAAAKTFSFRDFEKTVTEGVGLPPWGSRYSALVVILAEALAGLLSSLTGAWARPGVSLALFLSLLFTGFVATMLVQGRSIRCNCFGQSDDRLSPLDLVRNGVLTTACSYYLFGVSPARSISTVACFLLLAMATIALLVSVNLKGIAGILRME
ncbi:MAG TPA: MauE/DoxX family redox-associated membrane protein [Rhizomicrobium sp.]|jgi:hypothetical protein|nr:MauE/DoxX family redox-associated membrane protein [Rhizomicrobium sp.]